MTASINSNALEQAPKAGGTPYDNNGKPKRLSVLLAEIYGCDPAQFLVPLTPIYEQIKVETEATFASWFDTMAVNPGSPYFQGDRQALIVTLPLFPQAAPLTVTAAKISSGAQEADFETALAMALLAAANPGMQGGVTINGTPREQLLLSLALSLHGVKVDNPAPFDQNNPDHAALQQGLIAAATGFAATMDQAPAPQNQAPDQEPEQKEAEADEPPTVRTINPQLLAALRKEHTDLRIRSISDEELEQKWQKMDEAAQNALLAKYKIKPDQAYQEQIVDDYQWDKLPEDLQRNFLINARQQEGMAETPDEKLQELTRNHWDSAPYKDRKQTVAMFEEQAKNEKIVANFKSEETPENLEKIKGLSEKLHPNLRLDLRLAQHHQQEGSADALGYFDIEKIWNDKTPEEQQTILAQKPHLQGKAYYKVPQDEQSWDRLAPADQEAISNLVQQNYGSRIPAEALETFWNIQQDEDGRSAILDEARQHAASQPDAPMKPVPDQADEKDEEVVAELAKAKKAKKAKKPRAVKQVTAAPDKPAQPASHEKFDYGGLPRSVKTVFQKHSARISEGEYDRIKQIVISEADKQARDEGARTISRERLADAAKIGAGKISAVFEALQKEGVIEYVEGARAPRHVTVKPGGRPANSGPA